MGRFSAKATDLGYRSLASDDVTLTEIYTDGAAPQQTFDNLSVADLDSMNIADIDNLDIN